MTQRRHTTLVAAGATVLAALPLATIFEQWTWLIQVLIVLAAMTGAAVGLRSIRSPAWLPTVGQLVAYVLILTWLYSDRAFLGILPDISTVVDFNDKLVSAGTAIQQNGVPVPDDPGLLFLAGLGIGAVLVSVDLAAVVARRPAIAGLPMVAIYLVAVGTHGDSVSFLSFVATAAGFMWLLATDNVDRVRRFGRRFTGDGRDVDVWEPSPLAAAGRRLAIVGVAAAVLLPIAIPGMTTGLLDRFGSGVGSGGSGGNGNGNGNSGRVNLFSVLAGSLNRERSYLMMRFSTNDPNPFYVRFGVAEDVNNDGFFNRNFGPGVALNNIPTPTTANVAGVSSRSYHANIEILAFDNPLLPVFELPTKVNKADRSWLWDARAGVVYSNRDSAKGMKYDFDYVHQEFTPDALRTAPHLTDSNAIAAQFTKVPSVAAVKAKADELTKGKRTEYDKARAIYDFFTNPDNKFQYNPSSAQGNSGSKITDFLTNRTGYCEQYAAAMAWLVRAAGIPARVAFGFTRGNDRSTKDNVTTYTLNNYNLHAWTEVYFEGFGWVPFDATPASSIAGSVSTAWAPDPSRPINGPADDGSSNLRPGQDPSGGPEATESQQPTGVAGGPGSSGGGLSLPRWPFYVLGGLLVAILLLCLPAVRRSSLRRRRRSVAAGKVGPVMVAGGGGAGTFGPYDADDPVLHRARQDAHAAWDELVDTMTDFRITVDPAETPRATVERIIAERHLGGSASDGAGLLGRAEERARYARTPLLDAELSPALQAVRGTLRGQVSFRTRFMATLFPRSVLLRWRTASEVRSTAFVNAMGARRDRLSRALNPRRLMTRGAR